MIVQKTGKAARLCAALKLCVAAGTEAGMPASTVLLYNSFLSLPFALGIAAYNGTLGLAWAYLCTPQTAGFWLTFVGTNQNACMCI